LKTKEQEVYLSIVIPLINEEESLNELFQSIKAAIDPLKKPYEVIFVDDGSVDTSFEILKDLHKRNKNVKVLRFRRNYGKAAALSIGFRETVGKYVVTMDADLQDDPNEIPEMVKLLQEKYDLVSGWKKTRHDPITKTFPSRFFNFVVAKSTGIPIHDFNCGLKAYRSEVVKEIQVYGELHRYIPVLAHWSGYRVGEKAVVHHARKFGTTKYGVSRLLKGYLDLITVLYTTRYIKRPLHFFGLWGTLSFLIGVFIDGYLSVEWLLGKTSLSNRPLFMVGFLFMIIGIQFVSIGLIGEMITKGQSDEKSYSIREILK
jgi:glycosyltransferase involved in cell wall biosynthesis